MRRLTSAARYVGGELAALLAIVLFALVDVWPRRVPDLRRLTARRDFAATHGAMTSWLDRHFELIESEARWLHPVGRGVEDSCRTTWHRAPFSLERKPARVVCTRWVWAAFGCDGDLQSGLTALSSALSAIGWGNVRGGNWDVRGGLSQSASQMRTLSWDPGGRLAPELLPLAGRSEVLRESVHMYVSWADRAEPGDMVAPRRSRSADPARATLLYQPVEVSDDDAGVVAASALLRYDSTIMINVGADYYKNENVNARPDRLRKRLRVISGF